MNLVNFFNEKNSIIRRSLLVLFLNVPVGVLGLALNFLSTKISNDFGLFLLNFSLINILCSGAIVLNIICTDYCLKEKIFFLVEKKFKYIFSIFLLLGLIFLIVTFFLSLVIINYVNISFELLIAIFLSSILIYVAEMGRVYLQCKDNFFFVGLYMISMFFFRLTLTLTSLYLFEKLSISILIFGIASIIPFCVIFLIYIQEIDFRFLSNLKKIKHLVINFIKSQDKNIFLIFVYVCFGIINFSDLILSYLFFSNFELNLISSSILIPKGLLVFTFPLIHVFLVTSIKSQSNKVLNLIKSVTFTLVFSIFTVIVLKYLSNFYCGNDLGITSCSKNYLFLGLNNFVLLILLRLIVVDLFNNKIFFSVIYLFCFLIFYFFISYYFVNTLDTIFVMQRYTLMTLIFLLTLLRLKNI